ncbi:YopX family protein [Bacillus subtilis]|uniref:YopX family protein n=1 Tax=Bacillus subtilis TaxID=1423 RepID=UPI002716AE5D|nr:YopX family protein [Bacillus subtilis]MDP0485111.1 YopX family protein [Bacillus subtilis]
MNTAYRVWDGKRMYYSDDDELTMIIEPSGAWEVKKYGMRGKTIAHSHDGKSVLMWGTGLNDKKGKDIYQKDITDESYIHPMSKENIIDRYVIERKNGFDRMEYVGEKEGFYRHLWLWSDEVEVIGNIYQNPELLEGAECQK